MSSIMLVHRIDPFRRLSRLLDTSWMNTDFVLDNLDLTDQGDQLVVRVQMPGLREADIDVRVDGNMLTISAETHNQGSANRNGWMIRSAYMGRASQSIRLPAAVDSRRIRRELKDGVLTVKLPKAGLGQKIQITANPVRKLVNRIRGLLPRKSA